MTLKTCLLISKNNNVLSFVRFYTIKSPLIMPDFIQQMTQIYIYNLPLLLCKPSAVFLSFFLALTSWLLSKRCAEGALADLGIFFSFPSILDRPFSIVSGLLSLAKGSPEMSHQFSLLSVVEERAPSPSPPSLLTIVGLTSEK